jgi:LacI family transcriptional regulator
VPLSSIRQPAEAIGATALELLVDEIKNADTHSHRHVMFQPELVIRASSVTA